LEQVGRNFVEFSWSLRHFFSTILLMKDPKSMKNAFLWYVAVEGAKVAVVLG
jgi:hypothetical protein